MGKYKNRRDDSDDDLSFVDKDKYAVGDEDVTISVVEWLAIDRGMA